MKTLLLLLLANLSLAAAPPAPAAPHIAWESDFTAATKKAKAAGKPVMIDFWADWCGWCHRLDETTYVDPGVVALSRDFVAVKVNAEGEPDEAAVALRFGVDSLPTILFLTPEGRTVLRLNGYLGPKDFLRALEATRQRAREVASWERALAGNPKDASALVHLGFHLLEQDMVEEGRELLVRAQAVETDLASADRKRIRLVMGFFKRADHLYPEAEATFREGLKLTPTDPELDAQLLYALARLYSAWDKRTETRATLRQLVKAYPKSRVAQQARAMLPMFE